MYFKHQHQHYKINEDTEAKFEYKSETFENIPLIKTVVKELLFRICFYLKFHKSAEDSSISFAPGNNIIK